MSFFAFHSTTLDCPFLIYHFWLPIWCLQSFLPPLGQVQDQSYKLDTEYHKSSSDTTIYTYCIYYMLVRRSRKCVYYNSVTTFIFLYYSAQFHAFTYGSFDCYRYISIQIIELDTWYKCLFLLRLNEIHSPFNKWNVFQP